MSKLVKLFKQNNFNSGCKINDEMCMNFMYKFAVQTWYNIAIRKQNSIDYKYNRI